MLKILFTICGRAGSKGIKNKNIRDFCDFPLPYYSLAVIDMLHLTDLEYDCDIVASSDSNKLIDLVNENPFEKVYSIHRDEYLSGDTIPKIAVISDCLSQMEKKMQKKYDIVVDLDITSPLRTNLDLYNLINKHITTGADVTTSVTESRRNPYFNMLISTKHGFKKVIDSDYTARQQAPEIYDMNASLYAYSTEYLNTGKGVLDGYCECIKMYDTGILDLDHEGDFELMEIIAKYLFEHNEKFKELYKYLKGKCDLG